MGQWVDQIEEVIGFVQQELQRSTLDNQREFSTLREEMLLMNNRLELLLAQCGESTLTGSMTTEKSKKKASDGGGYNLAVVESSGSHGNSQISGSQNDL